MNRIATALLSMTLSPVLFAETIWLDVRSEKEYQEEYMPNSIHIPHTQIKSQASSKLTNKQATINVYCVAGYRAGKAKSVLEELGYTNVVNVVSLERAIKLNQ